MLSLQDPLGFEARTEAQKVTYEFGFRISKGVQGPWMRFGSTTATGDIWIAAAGEVGPWAVAFSHPGVAAELVNEHDVTPPPGAFGVALVPDNTALYAAVRRAYQLGLSLPDAPLQEFEARTKGLPKSTEAERLVIQRVGQDVFRKALLEYWGGVCPLTGINDPPLLRASHIVPWSECQTDAHRLDAHNGLLLSALWDAAFDAGLISFSDDGTVLVAQTFDPAAAVALNLSAAPKLAPLTLAHRANLAWHRRQFGFDALSAQET